ncbi:putative reverse transcriptase domain-containing protein, partial [Tanacetum coccineum]
MLAADHKRQVQLTKALKLVKRLQTQMTELQRQQGPANGPAQPDAPKEAGTEGVSGLSQWFERMDSVFHISNCIVKNQVKFATCTLYSVALTWSTANANNANNQRGTGSGQRPTCFECGVQGHFKREYPKLNNNNNRGNQVRSGNAPAKVYTVRHVGTNPDSNVITGTFLLNNCYASILFDTSVDRSFVSTAFSSQIDITPTALDHYYDVELAD